MTNLGLMTLKHSKRLLIYFAPSILFLVMVSIPNIHFLLIWYFRLFDSIVLGFLIYILFFSVLYALIEYIIHMKKEPPYIDESSFSTYFIFITLITFIIFTYMLISTVFSNNYYSISRFLTGLVSYIVALLLVYIPIQFIAFVEDSNILSVLFSFFIRFFTQVLLYFIIYILLVSA
jgi:hypothetical protein